MLWSYQICSFCSEHILQLCLTLESDENCFIHDWIDYCFIKSNQFLLLKSKLFWGKTGIFKTMEEKFWSLILILKLKNLKALLLIIIVGKKRKGKLVVVSREIFQVFSSGNYKIGKVFISANFYRFQLKSFYFSFQHICFTYRINFQGFSDLYFRFFIDYSQVLLFYSRKIFSKQQNCIFQPFSKEYSRCVIKISVIFWIILLFGEISVFQVLIAGQNFTDFQVFSDKFDCMCYE